MADFLSLADIPSGGECIIVKVHGHGGFRNRIIEMGFVRGEVIKVIKNAPLSDPIEYEIMGAHISLRRNEAKLIEVFVCGNNDAPDNEREFHGTIEENGCLTTANRDRFSRNIDIAIVGNPNIGKTSLFNKITGLREKTGNYGGVTVGAKEAVYKYKGYHLKFIDLPGTYSINDYSPEEVYVRRYITEQHPDIVLNIVNAANLERNMLVTTQLIDMNVRMVMALNMYDELEKQGDEIDIQALSRMLGFPIIPTVASKGVGITALLDAVIDTYEGRSEVERHIHINYGLDLERAIENIKEILDGSITLRSKYHTRYLAIRLLKDVSVADEIAAADPQVHINLLREVTEKEIKRLETSYKEDVNTIITSEKYGFINGALKETLKKSTSKNRANLTEAIDTILTNKWLGIPFLILFIWIMFQATFWLGQYPMDWIESGVAAFGSWVSDIMPPGELRDLLVDGIITGVGSVLVFLPNIVILFTFISFFEDSGYMARAAFIMDRIMHRIGLHGKSFIPLLMGFGCNVPAILATRTLESRKDRIMTILMIPFMSCSARLPIYMLFVTAFFEKHQALILMSLYAVGILVGVISSLIGKRFMFKKQEAPFVMELPPYRIPTFRNIFSHMWHNSSQYLKKISSVILVASIAIWALGYFPRQPEGTSRKEQVENSYIGKIGHAIEPVVRPLGFDWKMGVGIVTGFGAKEIIVSTLGILYNPDTEAIETLDDYSDDPGNLAANLRNAEYSSGPKTGEKVFTPLIAYGFLLFVLLYMPCAAAITTIYKELNWRWALLVATYTTAVAWIVSFMFHLVSSLF